MTRKEAIKALSLMEHVESIAAAYEPGERRQDTTVRELKEACRMASETLRTQRTPAKLDRSRWEGCEWCKDIVPHLRNSKMMFCIDCGRPLTEEAWAELERRIGGNNGTTD